MEISDPQAIMSDFIVEMLHVNSELRDRLATAVDNGHTDLDELYELIRLLLDSAEIIESFSLSMINSNHSRSIN
jgi:hypothetical protein